MERVRLDDPPAQAKGGGMYFPDERESDHFSSGGATLDCILGGHGDDWGWAENKIINVVGDSATGKSLLAIEAAANYRRKYPKAPIHYVEAEEGFDMGYAAAVGLPKGVRFPNRKTLAISTVEDLERDLHRVIAKKERALYIVDSLDALSDESEQARDIGEGTYGGNKPKQLSTMFRKLNAKLSKTNVTVIIISQVRDAIGVTFGRKQRRSGGKALDFYASQILWLAHIGRLKRTRHGVTRPYGVMIRAQSEKSRVGMPFRVCDFPIHFAFGIEDIAASIKFLRDVKRRGAAFKNEKAATRFLARVDDLTQQEYDKERAALRRIVFKVNAQIEKEFAPKRRKYC